MGPRHARALLFFLAFGLTLSLGHRAAVARDDFVNRVNATFSSVPKDKRSDLVVLPVLAKLESPPAEVATFEKAVLLFPNCTSWETATNWAKGAPQQALLQAIAQVTKEEDHHVAMVFAQPYGVEEVADTPELIQANMYTELGDPQSLATAKFGYLKKMEELEILANVEATRQMGEGNFIPAVDTLFHFLYFARQMADRPMLPEKRFGMVAMKHTLQRIRDIVYQDMRGESRKLAYKDLRKYVERLEEEKGYLGIARIRLPIGTFIAADQVLHRVLVNKGGVNNETFAVVLARIASQDRPWRLFSESAYWESIRPDHEGYYATRDMLVGRNEDGGLAFDWHKRWNLDPHDALLKIPTDYQRHVARGARFAALRAVLTGVEDLNSLRLALRTEVAGTRMSLAVYGFTREHHESFPRDLSAIRPAYVSKIDRDPYSSSGRPIEYFVPIRDDIPKQDPRKDPIPLMVRCYPAKPFSSFVVPLRDDTFVLYSVGPDDTGVVCKDATQEDPELEGDYLLWPPMISIGRQHLIDTDQLK